MHYPVIFCNEKLERLMIDQFQILPGDDLPSYAEHAVSFTSYTINPEAYIPQLLSKFSSLGGQYFRKTVTSLYEAAASSPRKPLAIINCTGLGAKALGDANMYPVRGQVVVISAPHVLEGRTLQEGRLDDAAGEGGQRTYVIPRSNGHVVLGGTREVDDW
jgi:D-amino-acid oxidase